MIRSTPHQSSNSVRSVERTLDILVALEKAGQPLGLSELSRATEIPKATTQRLLSVLERRGFVQKERLLYHLGPGVVPLAGAFLSGNSLARAALPVLEELALLSDETVSLQVRQGFDRVVIQRVQSRHSLGYILQVGQRLPLHVGAASRVLMLAMPEDELRRFLDTLGEMRLASGKPYSKEALLAKLEEVRRQGFAVSWGERESGVVSIAAPVSKTGRGTIAALALTGPANRMTDEKIEHLSVEVRRAAVEVARLCSRV
ncbi:MAG: IclR family transcriptional regulator [Sphingomonadaceae bacterium]